MQRLGFIRDMMDVKVLILFVMSRIRYPATAQEIYEICYQDDCLSYFDVCSALPEMVASEHLLEREDHTFEITEKGREDCRLTEDSIAYSVRRPAENAADRFNRKLRMQSLINTRVDQREAGDYSVTMMLDNEFGRVMTMELMAPDQTQADRLCRLFDEKAEDVYNMVMTVLLDEEEDT